MDEFFKQLQLSNDAIEIYKGALGKIPLTFNELHLLIGDLSIENFTKILNELKNANLIVEITPQKPEILIHYLAVAPITPILNFFSNIDAKLGNLNNAVKDIVVKSINQIYQRDDGAELKSLHDKFHELRKDFDEDSMIQKKDVEEIVENMEKDILNYSKITITPDNMKPHISKNIAKSDNENNNYTVEIIDSYDDNGKYI